jgi:hypothetical protein
MSTQPSSSVSPEIEYRVGEGAVLLGVGLPPGQLLAVLLDGQGSRWPLPGVTPRR